MINFFIVFILTFLVSSWVTPIVRRTACRLNLLDTGSNRTVHKVPVPRIGGVGIFLSFLAGLAFIMVAEYGYFFKHFRQFFGILTGGTLIFIIGLYDDVYGIDAKKKFFLQILVSLILVLLGFKIQSI
ncbi:hypothetical protein HY745_01375 [Candidatus Desantisbacteria bacterium]|nr:hypothetical protein [Candidatus Desantisbacteria bacterium]